MLDDYMSPLLFKPSHKPLHHNSVSTPSLFFPPIKNLITIMASIFAFRWGSFPHLPHKYSCQLSYDKITLSRSLSCILFMNHLWDFHVSWIFLSALKDNNWLYSTFWVYPTTATKWKSPTLHTHTHAHTHNVSVVYVCVTESVRVLFCCWLFVVCLWLQIQIMTESW